MSVPAIYNGDVFRIFASRSARRESINVGVFGDSWVEAGYRIADPLTSLLDASLGVSSPGYLSANAEIDPASGATRVFSGDWTGLQLTGIGPEGAHGNTTDTNAKLSFTREASLPVSKFRIHYLQQPKGGTFGYAIDSGPATYINTDGPARYSTIDVVGANGTLNLTIASATTAGITFAGVEILNQVAGETVVHKLGGSGMKAGDFAALPAPFFDSAVSALQLHLAFILLGTNDHSFNVNPIAFYEDLQSMGDRIVKARSNCNIGLIGPGDNSLTGRLYRIDDYNHMMYDLAQKNGWGFASIHKILGSYFEANALGFYDNGTHISADGGAVAMKRIHDTMLWPDIWTNQDSAR